jgi:uncharacterized protein (DUF697 family)
VTYFLAWGIVVILLMVIGSLATAVIRTGSQLALYALQVKRFANQLLKEDKTTKRQNDKRIMPAKAERRKLNTNNTTQR